MALFTTSTYLPLNSIAFHMLLKLKLKCDESGFVYNTDLFLDRITAEPHIETPEEMSVIQWNLKVVINNLYHQSLGPYLITHSVLFTI